MDKPLFIVWQDGFSQQQTIIDEQHHALVATINSLNYFLQEHQLLDVLTPTLRLLTHYMQFHYKTEQGILQAMEYPDLKGYIDQSNQIVYEFKQLCEDAIHYNDPEIVMHYLRDWWHAHLHLHDKITSYLHDWRGEYCRVENTGREKN